MSIKVVDAEAFLGDQSVRELSIRLSHLSDTHLPALLALTQLRSLDIALNGKITGVDRLLGELRSLERLDASNGGVSSLTSPVSSSTLRVLNLADNPLINVATDAFVGLTALQQLRLDGARLTLANDSFASQRLTLRTLSLRRCNFTRAPWPSIAGLSALENLFLSQVTVISKARVLLRLRLPTVYMRYVSLKFVRSFVRPEGSCYHDMS